MNAGVLVFAALFAFAGYREAQRFQRQYGNTPWGGTHGCGPSCCSCPG